MWKYHDKRPRLASRVASGRDPKENSAFRVEAIPQFCLGKPFVLGDTSLRANNENTFLLLPNLKVSLNEKWHQVT